MPQYTYAADVRKAHPGVYDDLTDQQIEAGLAKQNADRSILSSERYLPHEGEDSSSAFAHEAVRSGERALLGVAHSPIDAVRSLFGLVPAAVKGVGDLVADPSLIAEAPRALWNAGSDAAHALVDPNTDPFEMGSALGQMAIGEVGPGVANAALRNGPNLVGRGVSALGRATETAGKSKVLARARSLAPYEAMTGHFGPAAISAVAPDVLQGTGRLLQRGGGSLEGLDLSFKGRRPFADIEASPETVRPPKPAGFTPKSTEVPYAGEADMPGHWERSPSSDPMVPGRRNPSLAGLEDAAPNKWAGDKSAQREIPVVDRPYETADYGTDNAFTRARGGEPTATARMLAKEIRPIDAFYENDPQARGVGGEVAEGRTTGKFPEGKFGLNNLEANKPYETPGSDGFYNNEFGPDEAFRDLGTEDAFAARTNTAAPPVAVDSLADLSARMGRQMSPEEASMLFNRRFGLGQPAGRR